MSAARARIAVSGVLRSVAGALVIGISLSASHAQQPPQPMFRTGVDLVTIDVAVLGRDDTPVEGLTPDDFAVTVDGRPRRIATFRFVRAGAVDVAEPRPAGQPAAQPALAVPQPPPGRSIIIVVDRDQIPAGGGRPFLEAGASFVDSLAPNDRVALWSLPVTSTAIQYIADREQLKRELLRLVGTARLWDDCLLMSPDEAIAINIMQDRAVLDGVIGRECGKMCACKPVPASVMTCDLPDCVRRLQGVAMQIARDVEASLRNVLGALEGLVQALASLDGVKHVVLISGGNYVPPDMMPSVRRLGDMAAASRVHIHALQPWNVLQGFDVAIQGPASRPRIDQSSSAPYMLAGVTGGLAITTPTGEAAFTRLSRVLAAAYILGVETEPGERDGKPHDIRVRMVSREGVTVRARQQFRIDPRGAVATASAPAPVPTPAKVTPPATPPEPEPGSPSESVAAAATMPDVLTRLSTYVEQFEREFSSAVAEERYVQLVRPWRGNPKSPDEEKALQWTEPGQKAPASGPIIARRLLLSDVLLVQIPGRRWLGYRDVAVVDGGSIHDRSERVRDLFLSKAADREEQLRRVADESARYNLGAFRRNMNIPTLALSFMHPRDQGRFEFTRAKDETVGGLKLWLLRYVERARPTLIGTSEGRNVPIEGRLWIDPATGRIWQTEVRFQHRAEERSSIVTRFRAQAPFSVLVPDYMWEWYESGDVFGRQIVDKTLVECLARYSNYRQFRVETTEAIK